MKSDLRRFNSTRWLAAVDVQIRRARLLAACIGCGSLALGLAARGRTRIVLSHTPAG